MFRHELACIAGYAAHEAAVAPLHEFHVRIMRNKVHITLLNDYIYIFTYLFLLICNFLLKLISVMMTFVVIIIKMCNL